MICNYFPEPTYLFFTTDLPPLLYYSHIPVTIIALFVGFFVFLNNRKALLNKLLLLICLSFSGWTILNLFAWTNIHVDFILFIWPFFAIFSSLMAILCVYFIYVFLHKKDVPTLVKSTFILLLTPIFIFAHTDLNVSGFNISDCDAFGFEGDLYSAYNVLLGFIAMAWILLMLIKYYLKEKDIMFKKKAILMGTGVEFFLFSFITITYLSSYFTNINVYSDSRIEFYGLFGMTAFMVFITILIVKFKVFNIKLLATQALVIGLIFIISAELFFVTSMTNYILVGITLTLACIGGYILVKSVKKEVALREQIEGLVVDLNKANERLKILDKMKSEFVSIASHQLRSPLTSIRGYASMLAEGSYGKLPPKVQEIIQNIADSSMFMAQSVEDYLNVSRIEAGNMKYEMSDFNLKEIAEKIVDEIRSVAMKKGLVPMFRSDCTSGCITRADIGKTRQVIMNILDNSMKYTPKGTITVVAHDDVKKKKVYITIQDTGVGMSKETQEEVFDKFIRAKNANSINVTGTGLGLFVAKKMIEEMGGRVWAESKGEGTGSTFHIELPLVADK